MDFVHAFLVMRTLSLVSLMYSGIRKMLMTNTIKLIQNVSFTALMFCFSCSIRVYSAFYINCTQHAKAELLQCDKKESYKIESYRMAVKSRELLG